MDLINSGYVGSEKSKGTYYAFIFKRYYEFLLSFLKTKKPPKDKIS